MKDKTKSILVALSFIVAMILFVWGFNFLKGKSILKNQLTLYAVYDNSKGLLPGDLVTINGMQVGTVSSLKFHPRQDGSVIVTFTINNDLEMPSNTKAKLSSSLMGSVSIELILGDSRQLLQSGDTLVSQSDTGTMEMISETILPIKNNLETLLVSLNDLTNNLNDLINNELKYDLNRGVDNFANSMENIKVISADLQQLVDSEDGKLVQVVNNLEVITEDFAVVSDSLKRIDYNRMILSLENCIAEFNALLEGINNGEGSAGLLVKDDSLYINVNETVATLQSLLDEIKANLDKLITQYPSGMSVNSLLAAKNFGVFQEHILVGNGAAELIKSIMEKTTGRIGFIKPTFEEYPNRYNNESVIFVPDNTDLSYTAKDLMDFYADKNIGTLVLINPDNPSGNYIPYNDLLSLIKWCSDKNIRIIVDESFCDFADEGRTLINEDVINQFKNLIIIKSISKSYGVPGLRLGILVSTDNKLVSEMKKDVAIWNINSIGEFYMQIAEKYNFLSYGDSMFIC